MVLLAGVMKIGKVEEVVEVTVQVVDKDEVLVLMENAYAHYAVPHSHTSEVHPVLR